MNREQMIEKAARVLADQPIFVEYATDARAVVDALLPQVSTVEELEALPEKTIVVAADGSSWFVDTWDDVLVSCCFQDEKSHVELLRLGPLTVVWQP